MQNVTLSAWVRTTEGGSTYNSNWSILDFDNANYYAFYVRGDNGKVGFSFCNNQGSSTAVRHLSSNTAVNDGRWHHITVVFGDKTNPNNYTDVKFYIDGQLDNHSYNANWGPTIGKPNTTRYGFIGDGSKATSPYNLGMRYKKYYHGSIDELAYWHSSLTTAQVQNLYNSGVQAITTNPQAWYSFDNQTTATVYDNSPNGYNGTAFKNGNTGSPQQFTPATAQRITASSALATVLSYTDYYPFGMPLPGRQANLGSYRYGFNGMEKDGEINGEGNSYTTEFRQYDARIGRWLSTDPLMMLFAGWSPYNFCFNDPLNLTDVLGDCPDGNCPDDKVNVAAQRIVNNTFDPNHNLKDNTENIESQVRQAATIYNESGEAVFNEAYYNSLLARTNELYSAYFTLDYMQPNSSYKLFTELISSATSWEDLGLFQDLMIDYAADQQTRWWGINAILQTFGVVSLINTSAISISSKGPSPLRYQRHGGGNKTADKNNGRLPQDIKVNSNPPAENNGNSKIGTSETQNAITQRYTGYLQRIRATDIRVNQQQVNAHGERVGINRPDIQFTYKGKRYYIEIDRSSSNRGGPHAARIRANDPNGSIRTKTIE